MGGQFHRILGAPRARSEQCGLLAASLTPSVPAWDVKTHGHAEAHFVCVSRGRYRSEAAGETSDTLLLFHPAAVEHQDCFDEMQRLQEAHFFALTLAGESARWCEHVRLPHWSSRFPETIARRCVAVLGAHLNSEGGAETATARLDLQQFVVELLGLLGQQDASRIGRNAPAWFSRVCESLIELGDAETSLNALAAAADVHPVHFARVFRRFTGCSAGEYRRRHQLRRALALLRNGKQPLTQIALESGFYDQAHFSRCFCARFGVTPSRFREQVANVQDEVFSTLQN